MMKSRKPGCGKENQLCDLVWRCGMTIYGDVKPEGENCLHITWESGDGTATFKVQEMTKEELQNAYDENGDGTYWK